MSEPSIISADLEQWSELTQYWQTILGLADWTLRVELVTFKRPWQSGDIKVDAVSKTALLLLSSNSFRDPEETIVHELVHLVLWPLDLVASDLIEVSGPEGSPGRDFAQSAFFRALEPVTEQLALSLLRAHGKKRPIAWKALEAEAQDRLQTPL